jgi:hypothetical protein
MAVENLPGVRKGVAGASSGLGERARAGMSESDDSEESDRTGDADLWDFRRQLVLSTENTEEKRVLDLLGDLHELWQHSQHALCLKYSGDPCCLKVVRMEGFWTILF